MLPGVYGFSWSVGNVIFLGVFYAVLAGIIVTMTIALYRSLKDFRSQRAESILWEADFGDLPLDARACRHQLSGEVTHRICDHAFQCGTCATHIRFLEREAAAEAQTPPARTDGSGDFGFSFPPDRLYHRGHTWVRLEPDGTATVGLDDFGCSLIGYPDSLKLPSPGARLKLNGAAWQICKSGAAIRILSPLDGEVIETGGPEQGWYLRLKRVGTEFDIRHLFSIEVARPWILREMERLQLFLTAEGLGLSLADGGEAVSDIRSAYPRADWETIWGDMFLQP